METSIGTNNTIQVHDGYPAVCVKVRYCDWDAHKIMEHFGCDATDATNAATWAWESACEQFWEYWQDKTGELENGLYGSPEYAYFPGHTVIIECGGRSGGWLEVKGLPDPTEYDEDDETVLAWLKPCKDKDGAETNLCGLWAAFEADVLEDVKYRVSWEAAEEAIEANDWAPTIAQREAEREAAERALLATLKAKYEPTD